MGMKKTILITGSTDGIGKLAALDLAKKGHRVFLHGRSAAKLEATVSEINTASGNNEVSGFLADLSNLEDALTMANQVIADLPQLDVLINNAGVFKSPVNHNTQGIDLRMVVNYLAPFVLTNRLFPLIQKSEHARIINLSSAAQAPVSSQIFLPGSAVEVGASYAQSKLALTMWSFDLAKRVEGTSVIAVNPGSLLNTRMVKEAYGHHWSSADKGANILVDLAVSQEFEGITGRYFDNDKGDPRGEFGPAHADAYDESKIASLIRQTDQLIQSLLPTAN